MLLADDHETVRQGLRLLIEGQPDMQVVGEAGDGRVALEEAARLRPDVVVMDVSMPEMNGLAATRALAGQSPHPAVIALTRHDDAAYVRELLAAGAAGYVLKQSASGELLKAIRVAASGGHYLDGSLTERASAAPSGVSRHGERPPRITGRESEVLRLMSVGHSNKDIATALNLSVKTVEVHKANAMRKLGLRGRIDVVRYAVLQGWLQEP